MAKASKRNSVGIEEDSPKQTKKEKKSSNGRSNSGLNQADVDIVSSYLTQQNRPYSLIDIFNNLHGSIGKTALQKILEKLVDDQIIIEKPFGKQTVFVVNQSATEIPSQQDLDEMDDTISQLKDRIVNLKDECRISSLKIVELQSKLTVSELNQRIANLGKENELTNNKIKELSIGNRKVNPEEKKKVDALYDQYSKILKERKRKASNIEYMNIY